MYIIREGLIGIIVQVNKFGKARPILNSWYPKYNKLRSFRPFYYWICGSGSIVDFQF
jgi:hypothetical protein